MVPKIELVNQYWSRFIDNTLTIDFIGYLDFSDRLFLNAQDLGKFLQERITSANAMVSYLADSFLPKVNGNFAIVIRIQNICILINDCSRTYPLFILDRRSYLTVSDQIGNLDFERNIDKVAVEEFLLTGFVVGNRSVFKNLYTIGAGELAILSISDIEYRKYFVLKSNPFYSPGKPEKDDIFSKMDTLFLDVFKRMISSCPDVNNWVVPLSGGHDSRLIINYLYRLGCENVVCFTYGDPNSNEAVISRRAAEALGFSWYFVDYSPHKWGELHENHIFDDYLKFAFNGCSLPHPQDLLAIYELKERSVISENDVIVPGHTAFTEAEANSIKELPTDMHSRLYVFNKYYNLFECKDRFSVFEPVLESVFRKGEQNKYSFPEFFNWQERQAKFINNSGRVYEFFNLKWRIPFWEKCVFDFWQNIEFDDRVGRSILFSASKEKLFHSALKDVPIINKFEKTAPSRTKTPWFVPPILVSIFVSLFNKKTFIPEGTNMMFVSKARSIYSLAGPLKLYPPNLRRYIRRVLPRKTHQINSRSVRAIYTLRNEILR